MHKARARHNESAAGKTCDYAPKVARCWACCPAARPCRPLAFLIKPQRGKSAKAGGFSYFRPTEQRNTAMMHLICCSSTLCRSRRAARRLDELGLSRGLSRVPVGTLQRRNTTPTLCWQRTRRNAAFGCTLYFTIGMKGKRWRASGRWRPGQFVRKASLARVGVCRGLARVAATPALAEALARPCSC